MKQKKSISPDKQYSITKENALKTFLSAEEAKIWDTIIKLDIKFSGYYHYDEELY